MYNTYWWLLLPKQKASLEDKPKLMCVTPYTI